MKCKSKLCNLESGHKGKCLRLTEQPAINTIAINTIAINTQSGSEPGGDRGVPALVGSTPTAATKTKNRRMRGVYNAYMREYMKKRRQVVAHG